MKKTEIGIIVLILVVMSAIACLLSDCQEEKKYGKGELPADYQELFGNSNTARLNYVQAQILNRHAAELYGVDINDPNNEQTFHKGGVIKLLITLEERIKKIENTYIQRYDPNDTTD